MLHVFLTFGKGSRGETVAIAGGSIAQLAIPLVAGALLFRQSDRFGAAVTGAWLSYSLSTLATYVADARAQELPLVGFTEDPEHDWYHLLARAGLLDQDVEFARMIRALASLVLALSLAWGTWLCLAMARSARQRRQET